MRPGSELLEGKGIPWVYDQGPVDGDGSLARPDLPAAGHTR